MQTPPSIRSLLSQWGGGYAGSLGIELDSLRPEELYKWLLAAILYGAPISERVATRTWREFARCGVLSPQQVIATGWDGLVRLLDAGGYARYDYKTATKLLAVAHSVLVQYGGDLNRLHCAAADAEDLPQRVMALGKGIGPVTAAIFLRELRGCWEKAEPPLSPLALAAARSLGLLPEALDAAAAVERLRQLWRDAGMPAGHFRDLESALVRAGLQQRRRARSGGSKCG